MGKVEHYLMLSRKYLEKAESLVNKGDYVQASEKLWGAAAEMVKAVASRRGLELKSHRDLWEFVTKLDREHPQLNLLELFHIANSLHTNFYEDLMTPEAVTEDGETVKELIEKLQFYPHQGGKQHTGAACSTSNIEELRGTLSPRVSNRVENQGDF